MLAIDASDIVFDLGDRRVLDHAKLQAEPGEIICIWGPSGGGKSTFLRVLGGIEKPSLGSVRFFGRECDMAKPSPLDEARDEVGFVFQNSALIFNMTIFDTILLPLKFRRDKLRSHRRVHRLLTVSLRDLPLMLWDRHGGDRDLRERVDRAMQNMLVYDLKGKFPHEISLGMQKRAAVARAMALNPKVLLLDEPTGGLDPLSRQSFLALVSNLNKLRNVTIVLVTHELDLPQTLGAKVSVMHDGALTEPVPFDRLRDSDVPFVRELFLAEKRPEDGEMLTDERIFERLSGPRAASKE